MTTHQKKELILNNLDCAHCATKIEQAVQQIDGVSEAGLDFVSKKLTFNVAMHQDLNLIMQKVKDTATKIEAGLEVVEPEPYQKIEALDAIISRPKLIRILIGSVLFAVAFFAPLSTGLLITIYLSSYLLIGGDVLISAFKNVIRGQVFDENFLMVIATIGAFSIQAFPEAVTVMLFYEIGEFFEKKAVGHSRRSIRALMDIRPDFANQVIGDQIVRVAPDRVAIGSHIIVKPGERIPLDGQVVSGKSLLDTSAITGESVPRAVAPGDLVYSGSINKNGLITLVVSKLFGDSTVSKILDLVQNASHKKAQTERFITRFARYYTPGVVFVATALAIIPPLVIPGALFSDWLYRALIFLVVSCPCALVISIPLGYFGGIGSASKRGILIKGSNYLEALKKVDTVVFDKTGTLTKGLFQVTLIHSDSMKDFELLELAAYTEHFSNHPIGQSILQAYGHAIDVDQVADFSEIAGFGIRA
ncbi:MAG: heavy metal translocating P-type ATPase, partial [Eubacteriales bacterium]|nr:heavy metal translocating P-type ATPase [Eubacteriales bacterium]